MSRARLAGALFLPATLLLCGCLSRSPVGTDHVGPEALGPETCALYTDLPSAGSTWLLVLSETEDLYQEDPGAVLDLLLAVCQEAPSRFVAFGIAELAYLAGRESGDPDDFLLSALAAYSFLEGDPQRWGPRPDAYDRRFRWACDFYNRSVGRAFPGPEPGTLALSAGERRVRSLPLPVETDLAAFPFEPRDLELYLAGERRVRGLRFRVCDSGLGAPLIAVVDRATGHLASESVDVERTSVSTTAFLRLDGDLADLGQGLTARLELHATNDRATVLLGERELPLEADQSATVAYGTELAGYWRHDLRGLFSGRDAAHQNGLILPRPFQADRIPVVLVHGTASSPTYWAELLNTMAADELVRSRYQFWLFLYTTGNPISYSARSLRDELEAILEERDPEGEHPELRRMVLIGHSQGGLVVKMLGVHLTADQVTQRAVQLDLDELELDEAENELMRSVFDLEPAPFVERLVFMSTPHRGSFVADSWFARMLARMIAVPGELVSLTEDVLRQVPRERLPEDLEPRVSTSLDNMNPGSNLLRVLLDAPFGEEIHTHSIIPIRKYEDLDRAHDGVVRYSSAHLEGVESEVRVPSSHSCQAHPRTLIEVRRILHEHLGVPTRTPRALERH